MAGLGTLPELRLPDCSMTRSLWFDADNNGFPDLLLSRKEADDDTGRLHRGATRRRADIVDRRRCEFRQRSDIVEQTYETTSHGSEN